jgi:hypothetical protein
MMKVMTFFYALDLCPLFNAITFILWGEETKAF